MGGTCAGCSSRKIVIARQVIANLIQTTNGVNFGVMRFNGGNGGRFISNWQDGIKFTSTIKDMDANHSTSLTNRQALINTVNAIQAGGVTPLAETLYEAMRYFAGQPKKFGGSGSYTSPIQASCQSNYVILITDGRPVSDRDPILKTLCTNGDCDGDGDSSNQQDYLDDVAKYLYDSDFSSTFSGSQNVKTYTIAFDLTNTNAVNLLRDTADNGQGASAGAGKALLAANASQLGAAFSEIILDVLNINTSFVAPVVPTSPENKVYSGERIYLGFFKPKTHGTWIGNLKKYRLGNHGKVLDKNGNIATGPNGAFVQTAESYWGNSADAGNVDEGGIGAILANRNIATRNIYTYTGTSSDLTDSSNAFTTSNTNLTFSQFGVTDNTKKDELINYIYGQDVYDEDIDNNKTEKRNWIMGDILHSKPTVQSYNVYSEADENDATKNKTVIFVGSNDGQLHAFSDATGEELWSIIPPGFLPDLHRLNNDSLHEYFMDGSPTVYVYDYDKDGNIGPGPEATDSDPTGLSNSGQHDKVILIINMRRGTGIDTLHATASRGYYFALDVTNPIVPKLLWSLDSTTLPELGEAWSDPVIEKIRLNGTDKLVFFIGAGYDNNEDLRFGNTQHYPDTTTATSSTIGSTADANNITSTGSSAQINPRGRGIYVMEFATLNSSGKPTFKASPTILWKYVYDSTRTAHNPTHSFPGEIAALDYDFDGYVDRLYAGDTGGNIWRFNIADKTSTLNWHATNIFKSNPSDASNSNESPATKGRKFFYRPSIVQEAGYIGIYLGSGDRAHPLNKAVTDRLYAFYDRDEATANYPKDESDLVNVTTNILQQTSTTATEVNSTLNSLYSTSNVGWFIKLNLDNGEKSLANPLVFNKVAYFTTFTPDLQNTNDPCKAGNLGEGRIYALNYKTGEAIFNFDKTNDVADDNSYASGEQERAIGAGSGALLRRSDRFKALGQGIPSGTIVAVGKDGRSSALVGCGGGICNSETKGGGTLIPLYWIME